MPSVGKILQQAAARIIVLCFVYQLGACPCGCWEHNAWLQMVGWHHEDHHQAATDALVDQPVLASAEFHDCTGQPQAKYLNNARNDFRMLANRSDLPCGPMLRASAPQGAWTRRDRLAIPPPPAGEAKPIRAALQVFRL